MVRDLNPIIFKILSNGKYSPKGTKLILLYESKIFKENNNLFGMKEARVRLNLAKGTQHGHAYYDDWKESLTDYALWYSTYANKCKNEKQLYKLLNKQYAEANYYPQALQRIIKRDQLESKFKK